MKGLKEIKSVDEITYPMYLNYVVKAAANGGKEITSYALLSSGLIGVVATALLSWAFGLYPLIVGLPISFMLFGGGLWSLPSRQERIVNKTNKLMRKFSKTKRFQIEKLIYEIEQLRVKANDERASINDRNIYIYRIIARQEQLQNLGMEVELDKPLRQPEYVAQEKQNAAVQAAIENGGLQVEDAVAGKQIDAQTVPTGLIKEMLAAGRKVTISFGEQIEQGKQSENEVETTSTDNVKL